MVVTRETVVEAPRAPVRWSAVFAGLVVLTASGWLLTLLGSAIGVSVADATDLEAMEQGFGVTAILWFVLSWLVAYFLGAMLTARLVASPDRTVGALHGITLWGAATVSAVLLAYWGVSGLLNTGRQVVSGVVQATGQAAAGAAQGVWNAGQAVAGAVDDSALAREIEAELKHEASRVLAQADPAGGADVRPAEVERAIEGMDARSLADIATRLASGDREGAAQALAETTKLSQSEVDAIVEGALQEAEELRDSDTVQAIEASLRRQVEDTADALAEAGGPQVEAQEVREALRDLDADTLREAGAALLRGDVEGVKDVLASRTTLDEQEIESIVGGVSDRFESRVQDLKDRLSAATETASDYSQAVLWAGFVGAALGLVACMGGGALGASAAGRTRMVPIERRAA